MSRPHDLPGPSFLAPSERIDWKGALPGVLIAVGGAAGVIETFRIGSKYISGDETVTPLDYVALYGSFALGALGVLAVFLQLRSLPRSPALG